MLGMPGLAKPLAMGANRLPRGALEAACSMIGSRAGIRTRALGAVDSERLARWTAGAYPRREYPAVMIGSSNGAAVHLCTALGIPWLPQTLLVPVRRPTIHPDDLRDDMEWGRENGRRLLDANPDLQLHHAHDPDRDRMMIRHMSFFRTKRLRLGDTFEHVLSASLEPGGTIFLLECTLRWPGSRVGERHVFQGGAAGGLEPHEYLDGSARVSEFLKANGSHRRCWAPPDPDGDFPEAEWGFEPALREDVERFAREKGFRVRRIRFVQPDHLSPLVADLYEWWYRQRRLTSRRLVVSSYLMMEPHWALRTGSIPFWCPLPMAPSADALESWLEASDAFDEIGIMLFSHGTRSAGLAPIERWRSTLDRARRKGCFLGVDEEAFPQDFASIARYHEAMRRLPSRFPMPGALTLAQLDAFLSEQGGRYAVQWLETEGRREGKPRSAPYSTPHADPLATPRPNPDVDFSHDPCEGGRTDPSGGRIAEPPEPPNTPAWRQDA